VSDLLESQRRRAEARERRRAANGGAREDDATKRDDGGGFDVKATAKAVAASAATGATLEAARTVVERATRRKDDAGEGGTADEGLDAKAAAKRAATAAAVGAGLAAASAITSRSEAGEEKQPEAPPAARSEPDEEAPEPSHAEHVPAREQPRRRVEERREPPDDVPGADLDQLRRVVTSAREQLEALQGRAAESVSGVERTPNGWTVSLEVVELARIPETTDVLATYELVLDRDANLVRYSRGRRYNRSQADAGQDG
jgi:hypothetical protein